MTPRSMFRVVIAVTLFLCATAAMAEIKEIRAHGDTFDPGMTIPLFVDSGTKNSIVVKGPFMDLSTGVESSDASFSVSIGRRVFGSNSAVEILVGADSAPDEDGSTIHIKFVSGEETFKVKAFKSKITSINILGKTSPNCKVGETVNLAVTGVGMNTLKAGIGGTMLDYIDAHYDLREKFTSNTLNTQANFKLKCTSEGTFIVKPTWFKDSRVTKNAGEAMVRGSSTLTVRVNPADPAPKRRLPGTGESK